MSEGWANLIAYARTGEEALARIQTLTSDAEFDRLQSAVAAAEAEAAEPMVEPVAADAAADTEVVGVDVEAWAAEAKEASAAHEPALAAEDATAAPEPETAARRHRIFEIAPVTRALRSRQHRPLTT